MKEIYICGVDNGKYSQIHHVGSKELVYKTFKAFYNSAEKFGLNKEALYFRQATEEEIKLYWNK